MWEAVHKFSTEVEMTHETEFTTVGFATLKVVKKNKNKFFKKKIFFWPQQNFANAN